MHLDILRVEIEIMTAKKQGNSPIPPVDNTQLEHVLEQRHAIAKELHNSNSKAQAESALAELTSIDEATQMALLKAMARLHDTDAADVLLAINELTPNKVIRKEARRALIQLAGSRIYPSWTPEPEPTPTIAITNPPRFWKGFITETREEGELELVLCWEQGFEYSEARLMAFMLDFWEDGIRNFTTEVGSKRHIDARLGNTRIRYSKSIGREIRIIDCTLAEGRRLVLEALSVNAWRRTTPFKEYRHHVPTVQQLVIYASDLDVDHGQTFINPDLEPDEIVGNFIGAWTMGDFGLCFDLLASDSPLSEELSRDEWIGLRRTWADEAHPARYEPGFLRERERSQQSIWLPSSALSDRISTQREVEIGWSLELTDTPLSGTLPEMPMGTAVYKETGRRWFWTSYTLVKEEDGWRIQRMRDEGASAQSLTIAELQQRLETIDERNQEIVETHQPNEPGAQQYYEEIIWRTIQALHYDDALLVKLPLDHTIYDDASSRARELRLSERAIVYLESIIQRFPKDYDIGKTLQLLAIAQADLSNQYKEDDMNESAEHFFELALENLQKAITVNNTALSHIILAEVLMTKDRTEEAVAELQLARTLAGNRDEEAQVESDLATIAMANEQYDEAIEHYKRVAEINPNYKGVLINLGLAYRRQEKYDEAIAYYQRALEVYPNEIPIYAELGTIYMTTSQLDQALEIVEQGLSLYPESAHLHALLAAIYSEKGDRRHAQLELAEAERINPDLEVVQAVREMIHPKRK
jgi:tetratricopeptide (TPR) repeat protein